MKKWYILVYGNGNREIMEKSEYEKVQREEYGIDATAEGYYDEALKGIVDAEHEPTWDDLEYDEETGTYFLKEKEVLKMLKKWTIELYREKCNCGYHVRHNNGGNYHSIDKLHLIGDDDSIYCVILEETDTRESFPGDQYETLVFQDGKFRLEDEEWADEADVVYTEEGYPILFRQGEAEIVYQNPWAFIEARKPHKVEE